MTDNQENVEKKVLVVEDEADTVDQFIRHDKDRFEAVGYGDDYVVVTLEKIEEMLRSTSYSAILLDGNLGLKLSSDQSDGQVIARKIRCGDFGSLNQETCLYSISSSHDTFNRESGIVAVFGKPRRGQQYWDNLEYVLGLTRKSKE